MKFMKLVRNEKSQEEFVRQVEARMEESPAVKNQPAPEKPETIKCPACGRELIRKIVVKNRYICYECGYYFRVRAKNRIRMVTDAQSFEPWFEEIQTGNPLDFPEYEDKIRETCEKTGLTEGVTVGLCTIYGEQTVLGVIDSRFLMGSMGHVVGEKITLAVERAT